MLFAIVFLGAYYPIEIDVANLIIFFERCKYNDNLEF